MSCDCITRIQSELREQTGDPMARVNVGFNLQVGKGTMEVRPYGLAITYRKRLANGEIAKKESEQTISATFCPWCGVKYGEDPAPVRSMVAVTPESGAGRIALERQRQIEVKGYNAARDDGYCDEELSTAAAVLALPKDQFGATYITAPNETEINITEILWPKDWDWVHFNTRGARITELAKAGALIAAEIDRHLRMEALDASES